MYKMEAKVRYSECGCKGELTLPAIINYFQDCSSAQSEALGVGMEYLAKDKKAWILNAWQIVIPRYPRLMEDIEVSTWPTGFKGVLGTRNYCLKTADGEMLAYANSLWVHMDMEKGRPARPDEKMMQRYEIEEELEMEHAPRKIDMPESAVIIESVPVRKYQIDTNHHVNNCQYVQMALEVLPESFEVKEVRVEYRKSAVLGDQIVVKRETEENRVIVGICDEDHSPYAVVEFLGEQK